MKRQKSIIQRLCTGFRGKSVSTGDGSAHLGLTAALRARESGAGRDDLAVFGTGTAAVISPVGELRYKDDVVTVNNFEIGELTQKLYDTLTGIQWGRIPDKYGWTVEVK